MLQKTSNKSHPVKSFFRKEKYVLALGLLLFALIWPLNHFYPISADDWMYSFNFADEQPVNSFKDILASQYWHYFKWGGRSIGHTIAQTLLWFGDAWGDWLNSMAFVAFITVIYVIANRYTEKSRPAVFMVIFLLLWFVQRHYLGECMFWITGSSNYLWCSLITLGYLIPICSYYFRPTEKKKPVIWSIALLFTGIVTGWTNENMSIGLIFFMAVIFALLKYEHKKIPVWAIWTSIGLIIGCIILLVAPGNYVRYNSVAAQYTPFSFGELLRILNEFGKFGILVSVIYLIVLSYFIKFNKSKHKQPILRLSLLFFCTAILAWFVMLASPRFPPRAWFGITSFAIVAIALLYAHIESKRPIIKNLNRMVIILGISLFAVTYALSLNETIRIRQIFDEREQYIQEQRAQGNKDITIEEGFECTPSPLIVLPRIVDLSPDASYWLNIRYAKYNGVDSVRIALSPKETK